jgi:hypothetical protein
MRYELNDFEWTAIKPMLTNKPRGVRRVNDRRVLNGNFGSCVQVYPGATNRGGWRGTDGEGEGGRVGDAVRKGSLSQPSLVVIACEGRRSSTPRLQVQ